MPRFRHTVYTLLIYLVNCDLTTCSPCKNGTKISTKSKFISRNDNSPLLYLEQERSQLSGHKNSTEKSIHRFQGWIFKTCTRLKLLNKCISYMSSESLKIFLFNLFFLLKYLKILPRSEIISHAVILRNCF